MRPVSFFLQNTKNKSKPAVSLKLLKKSDLDLAFWFQSLQLFGSITRDTSPKTNILVSPYSDFHPFDAGFFQTFGIIMIFQYTYIYIYLLFHINPLAVNCHILEALHSLTK